MELGFALPHYAYSSPDPGTAGAGGRTAGPVSFERVAGYAERAEAGGFAELWVSDHFWSDLSRYGGPPGRQGTLECWSTLSALAMRTRRVRLGSLVLAAGFRPPAPLAKMASTLDQLSGGRLDLGLGAGWNQDEFDANDLPFPPPGERLAMLQECLEILRRMLTDPETPASYQGRYFQVHNAPVIPGPVQRPRPPLWVGGSCDRMLGLIARVADGWNLSWAITTEEYDQRLEVLRAACARADRPLDGVRRSIGLATLVGRDADDLVGRWRRLRAWAHSAAGSTTSSSPSGPPRGWWAGVAAAGLTPRGPLRGRGGPRRLGRVGAAALAGRPSPPSSPSRYRRASPVPVRNGSPRGRRAARR